MNLTRKRKLIALITSAVMCLAILITAGVIFVPNLYKDKDTDIVTTVDPHVSYEDGGYGMTSPVAYTSNNTAIAYIENVESGYSEIQYPTKIYMDKTEDLKSLGYKFVVSAYYPSDANETGQVYFFNTFGYYTTRPTSVSESSDYNTLMRVFSNYDIGYASGEYTAIDNFYKVENGTSGSNGDTANDRIDNKTLIIKQNDHKKASVISIPMKGTPNTTGNFTYRSTSGVPLNYMIYNNWVGSTKTTDNSIKNSFTAKSGSNTLAGVTSPYTTGISISITLYDKSSLFNALKALDNKFNALSNAGLLLATEKTNYENYRNSIVTNYLNKREVTQSELDAKVTEVNSYVFNAYISNPSLGTMNNPQTANYTGGSYGLDNFWNGYTGNIPNTSTKYSDCFPAGSMSYSLTAFDGASTPVTDKNNLVNAGYYTVTFAPSTSTKTISVGGQNVNVKFTWNDNTTGTKTSYFRIIPADINLTNLSTNVEMMYKGPNTPNTLDGLPSGANIGLTGSGNTATVQLSIDAKGNFANQWQDVGNHLEFPDVTNGAVTVYYRVSATNHNDRYGTFNVTVKPADISIKLKHFDQVYYSDLLTSDEIFEQMLDNTTPNVLDATNFEETKAYLKEILTFGISKRDGGYFDTATDKPDVASYTVGAIKTTDERWANRINAISFVDDTNVNSYQITAKPIEVEWIDNTNKWYNNAGGHRPSAKIAEGQDTCGQVVALTLVSVDGGEAVNKGNYTARVATTNNNFVVSNPTHPFEILARKISIDICKRTITYAQFAGQGGIEKAIEQYETVILANNTNNEAYVATLDSEIATVTGETNALVHDKSEYKKVFTVAINAERTPAGEEQYYVVGEHSLDVTPVNDNYEITYTNGVFEVLPASLAVTINQLPPKVYDAEQQEIILPITTGENGTVTTVSGYEAKHPETISVEYSATGLGGPWSSNPLKIKNVSEAPNNAPKTIYYKITAPNHIEYKSSFTQVMSPANILVTFGGQTEVVTYGDPIPSSDDIIRICNIKCTASERIDDGGAVIAPEDIKNIHPEAIFDFYIHDPKTGQAVINRNADAGKYTITHRLKATVDEDINNFNFVYHLNDDGIRDNVDAYEISKKLLYVEWSQSGDKWSVGTDGVTRDRYTYSDIAPEVFPTAPNSYNGKENVVTGDSIYLGSQQLEGSMVNDDGYTITTMLTTERNKNNYILLNDTHTFYIDPLTVKIAIKDQTAKYGQAQQVPLGELIDPINAGALWDYATGSEARFCQDHYSNWKFESDAHSATGALVDVSEDGYEIRLVDNDKEGMDGTIRKNYNVEIVTEEGKNAKFYITPADIRFTGRQFNIDFNNIEEDNFITKDMLIKRISTGLETRGVSTDEFSIKMSDKFFQSDTTVNESNATWVEKSTPVTVEGDCGRYYVLFVVEHSRGNFNKFVAKVELNILSNWISVTIGSDGVSGEYGDEIPEGYVIDQLIEKGQIAGIAGFMSGDKQMWDVDKEGAIALLKEYVRFFVGTGSLNEEMTKNGTVGFYSIFMEVVKTNGEFENFRFIARNGENDTSNIDAFEVKKRTVSVTWNDMNEVYGEHGNSHTGYVLTNVLPEDVNSIGHTIIFDVDGTVPNNTASFVGGHAYTVGRYTAEITAVTNSNYTIDKNDPNLKTTFEITKKVMELDLHDREFVYGVDNALADNINTALNIYSQTPYYDIVSKSPFVGRDKRTDIFNILLDFDIEEFKASGLKYLPVDTYTITAEQLDTATSINYDINVVATGTLTIKEADAGLSVKQLTTMYFNASEQKVEINDDWIVLAGDAGYIKEPNTGRMSIEFKFMSRDDYREPTPEYVPAKDFTIRDAGRYVIGVRIKADNHKDFETEVNLNVTPANIIFDMHQAEKIYGDKIDNLSDWLKANCGITVTMYRDFGGGNRQEWDITAEALGDFEFYVVDPNKQNGDGGDKLQVGSYLNNVGDYRVYHEMANGALAGNYIPEYYQAPGEDSKRNAHAYKIIPRHVNVYWSVNDDDNWNADHKIYYYTGKTPELVATFNALPDESGEVKSVNLQISGINAVTIGQYTAQVVHSMWENNSYAKNYILDRDSYEFTIAKRPIVITVKDQEAGVYGTVLGGAHATQTQFTVRDAIANKDYNADQWEGTISLVLDGINVGVDEFLPAGDYAINAICNNTNLDVTVKGVKEGDACGWYKVSKATFNFAKKATYSGAKYLGEEFTLDFKTIIPVNSGAFVTGDDWQTAWANATIAYKQNGVDVDSPLFTGAGLASVEYTLTFANYNDFTAIYEIDVQKAVVNVSVSQVSSVYGSDLLTSAQIFANSDVVMTNGSDPIRIALDEIITLFVDASAKNAGDYNIELAYVGDQENNFVVNLVDNANKYVITPLAVEIAWSIDTTDESLDSDGTAYIFDGKPHKINFGITNVLSGDVIEPRFEETSQKDQAGTYIARLIGIGDNGNYTMPEDCSYEWTIKPRPISVTWTVEEYTYDGTSKIPSAKIVAEEVLAGTSCGIIVMGDEINAGTYTATASTTSSNYVVKDTMAEQSFTIKPKQINVIWGEETTFVYDGNSHAPTATINEDELVLIGEKVNVTVGGAQTNAGTYTATVAELDNSNYIVVGATQNFIIEKKQVTIHWTDTDFDYTGEEMVPNAKLEGVLNGDKVELQVSGGKTDAGTYTATATGVDNSNYVLASNAVKDMEFTIHVANNEFDGLYGIGDSKGEQVGIPWLGEDKPTDKFGGEVIVKYYEDEACTKEISADKIKDGTYWAVAFVEGTQNYNELQSSPFKFTIDNGMNVALAVCGIVISIVLLGGVLTTILVVNKKRKGGNV